MGKINLSKIWTNSKKRFLLILGYFFTGSIIISYLRNLMNAYVPSQNWQLFIAITLLIGVIYLDMKDKSWGYI